MIDGRRSFDMEKLSQWMDYMEDILGDVHLPTTLGEIKKSIEAIPSTYDTMDRKIQLIQKATVNNTSSTTSRSSQSQPNSGQGFNIY